MRKHQLWVTFATLALVVGACGPTATTTPTPGVTGTPGATSTPGATATPTATATATATPGATATATPGASPSGMPTSIGEGEGQLTILNWPGYVENGSTYPEYDWVTPFQEQSGCMVTYTNFGTSDEAFSLFTTNPNQYDVISASGDASKRLALAGYVQPVNVDLVPNYVDVYSSLKDQPYNTFDGIHYGIPHGRGANQLMYRTDKTGAQTRWDQEMFNPATTLNLSVYDAPIYIADAAVELMGTHSELGITDPYALDDTQFQAAVDLLTAQRPHIDTYWTDYVAQMDSFRNGDVDLGTTWQVIANLLQAETPPVAVNIVNPEEGATGWSDTWMINSHTEHINCAYKWLDWVVSAQTQADIVSYYGEAPANSKSCAILGQEFCTSYHAANDDPFWEHIYYWKTPEATCVDGRTDVVCKDFDAWSTAWTTIKG